ncbi:MAG: DUF3800 domain-containing protein [Elusimicrobiota bacterium]|jgi:hypothetical protein|nr:DUF3800 domain-containing protein [Elusimicrobiota bacterium]
MYIYLDESGDLGFDFSKKGTSKYFIICCVSVHIEKDKNLILKEIKRIIKKLWEKSKRNRKIQEIKSISTDLKTKIKLYDKIKKFNFEIYTMIVDKKKLKYNLTTKLYDYLVGKILEKIYLDKNVYFILDKSKTKKEINKFDGYIKNLNNETKNIKIFHEDSKKEKLINLADLFAWGIFKKYENKYYEWYDIFEDKIITEIIYK